ALAPSRLLRRARSAPFGCLEPTLLAANRPVRAEREDIPVALCDSNERRLLVPALHQMRSGDSYRLVRGVGAHLTHEIAVPIIGLKQHRVTALRHRRTSPCCMSRLHPSVPPRARSGKASASRLQRALLRVPPRQQRGYRQIGRVRPTLEPIPSRSDEKYGD